MKRIWYITAGIGLVLILALTYYVFNQNSTLTEKEPSASQLIAIDEVKKHSTKDDCWTIIDDDVYDITSYINRHPGGDEILRACGTDSTRLFKNRISAEGQVIGSGRPHSENAEALLETLRIGSIEPRK